MKDCIFINFRYIPRKSIRFKKKFFLTILNICQDNRFFAYFPQSIRTVDAVTLIINPEHTLTLVFELTITYSFSQKSDNSNSGMVSLIFIRLNSCKYRPFCSETDTKHKLLIHDPLFSLQ